jgi:hypothetical protein
MKGETASKLAEIDGIIRIRVSFLYSLKQRFVEPHPRLSRENIIIIFEENPRKMLEARLGE